LRVEAKTIIHHGDTETRRHGEKSGGKTKSKAKSKAETAEDTESQNQSKTANHEGHEGQISS